MKLLGLIVVIGGIYGFASFVIDTVHIVYSVFDITYFPNQMIRKTKKGYMVYSEKKGKNGKRKRLGGPYKTRTAAKKRLSQIEYFKHKGK